MRRYARWLLTIVSKGAEGSSSSNLHPGWQRRLDNVFKQPYMRKLRAFLVAEKRKGKTIYPPSKLTFNALNLTPFDKVKLIILGQDPYHNPGQAHGLCFSVPEKVEKPPSLRNIFKELAADVGVDRTRTDLSDWGEQGVLLLNSVLTVEAHKAASHANQGWEQFTGFIINLLAREHNDLAFILWGSYAKRKAEHIDRRKHFVVESAHPSPLSAEKGFFGSRPFSQVNAFFQAVGKEPIAW